MTIKGKFYIFNSVYLQIKMFYCYLGSI